MEGLKDLSVFICVHLWLKFGFLAVPEGAVAPTKAA
jgi:hypothetical protein